MTLLGCLLVETGRYEEALTLAADAKAIWLKALAQGTLACRERRRRPRRGAAGLRRFDEAEKLLLTSYKVLHEERGVLKIYATSSSRWLARLYQAMGKPEKAARYAVR